VPKNSTMTALPINDITSDFTHEIALEIGCQGSSGCQGTKSNPDFFSYCSNPGHLLLPHM
jgi:hypothetical protein